MKKKLAITIFLFALVMLCGNCQSNSSVETRNMNALRQMFKQMNNPKLDLADVEETHAKSYIQHVDGKTLNYDDYVAHHIKLKQTVSDIQVEFDHMVAKGNKVATVHRARATKKDGSVIKVKVNALFEFNDDGKLILCDELTHLIEGDEDDRDLGSRK